MTDITKERLMEIETWAANYGPGAHELARVHEVRDLARLALRALDGWAIERDGCLSEWVGKLVNRMASVENALRLPSVNKAKGLPPPDWFPPTAEKLNELANKLAVPEDFKPGTDCAARQALNGVEVTEEMADPSFPGALSDNEVRIWINACNHETARQALRQLLAYRVRGVSAALPPVDGLEVVMEKICHKEQIGIWANEITSALALSDFLREEWTFDDSVDLEREIAAQLRDIIKSAITHPGLDLVASLSQASSVIAGLTKERDEALRRESSSIMGEIEATQRISSLEEQNKRLIGELSRAERSFNNIRGAIESNQVVDKDAHGTAIRARDAARQALEDRNG